MGDSTDEEVDDFLATLHGPRATKLSIKEEEIAAKHKALAALKERKPICDPSGLSGSEEREKQLKHDNAALTINNSSSASSSSSGQSAAEALMKRKKEAEARLKEQEEVRRKRLSSSSDSSSRTAALADEIKSLELEHKNLPTISALSEAKDSAAKKLDRLQRGIDVCFLMDCTGSMAPFIKAAKEKILEIILKVENIEATAIMRVAFVGYRDYGDGDLQHVKVDFVEKADLEALQAKLAACKATGGGDGPEDIAGGLNIVTELSWCSSTRVLIHFADCPCHGSKYHASSIKDSYPNGDPAGLVPEELLRMIIKKRIDYCFMKITKHTDIMMAIFQETFKEVGKEIQVNPIAADASDFVPTVIKSITESMIRSADLKRIKN